MKKILFAITILLLNIGCGETKKEETKAEVVLPQYTTLFSVDLISGKGKFGEVLIPKFSKEVKSSEREKAFRGIMDVEGWVSISVYSTEDAYKANSSESFSKEHPNALKDGFLGGIDENGKYYE
jgi:intein/homing endonuclease